MPEIIRNEPIELSDDELEAVSGGQNNFTIGPINTGPGGAGGNGGNSGAATLNSTSGAGGNGGRGGDTGRISIRVGGGD